MTSSEAVFFSASKCGFLMRAASAALACVAVGSFARAQPGGSPATGAHTIALVVDPAPAIENGAYTKTIAAGTVPDVRGAATIVPIPAHPPVWVGRGQTHVFPLSGRVMNGAVAGTTVSFYRLNANGTKGPLLASAVTDVDGFYLVSIVTTPFDWVLAETSGGRYRDEATGTTLVLSHSDRLTAVFSARTSQAAVTPLTHMAAARARVLAAGGEPLSTAVSASNAGVGEQYQIPDVVQLLPVAADSSAEVRTSTRDQRDYGLVLAGIAQEAHGLGVRAIDLAQALATDVSDGILDGKAGASSVTIAGTRGTLDSDVSRLAGGTLTVDAGTSGVQTGINTFVGGARNQTGLDMFDILNPAVPIGPNATYVVAAVLPAARSGKAYGAGPLGVSGGTPPYFWSFAAGSAHPAWLGLTLGGQFGGNAPTLPPGSTLMISPIFVATVVDSSKPGKKVNVPLTIAITDPPPALHVFDGACSVNRFCSVTVATADGPNAPFAFVQDSLAYGVLPSGMHFDASGTVSGTATKAGAYPFGVCVIDAIGTQTCDPDPTITVTNATISPTSASFGASGGGGAVTVDAPDGFPWTAVSNDDWIAITGGGSGSGEGTVTYSVAANAAASRRTGTIAVAELTFTVMEDETTVGFPFDGSYTGNAIGTLSCPGSSGPLNAPLGFHVSYGHIEMYEPISGSGTVSSSGAATFEGNGCGFTGTLVVNGSAIQASGSWSCPSVDCGSQGAGSESGTWSAVRQ